MAPHQISPALLSAYFAMLVAFSVLKTRPVRGRGTHLLRALFPSWKFFEDSGDVALLSYRVAHRGQDFGPWRPCLPPPRRKLRALVWNPEGCFLLACGSLLQQLASDLQEVEEGKEAAFTTSVSYGLVRNLVKYEIAQAGGDIKNLRYQFKICAISPTAPSNDGPPDGDEMLLSPTYEDEAK